MLSNGNNYLIPLIVGVWALGLDRRPSVCSGFSCDLGAYISVVTGGRSLLPYLCNLSREVICKYMKLDMAQKGLYVLIIKVSNQNNVLSMMDSFGTTSGRHHNIVLIFLSNWPESKHTISKVEDDCKSSA